ncbi:MAG: peptide deformylase [Chitinispirillaceae bacterium]|nr:peptide deformylase [Chitinispirillaceae bacterium]
MSAKNMGTDSFANLKRLQLRVLPDQVLRSVGADIETFDKGLQDFAKRMLSFMRKKGGIGLAAPQVGVLRRIVVVGVHGQEMVLINPSIMPVTTDSDTKTEGCLSIPDETYDVTRLFQIEVRARDVKGKKLNFAAHNLLARVIQHEIDHLDGVLICDKEASGIGSRERGIDNANI